MASSSSKEETKSLEGGATICSTVDPSAKELGEEMKAISAQVVGCYAYEMPKQYKTVLEGKISEFV